MARAVFYSPQQEMPCSKAFLARMNRGNALRAALLAATAISLLAATGGTPPSRPPDGTYSYTIDGLTGVTQDTVTIVTKGTTISVVEHATISGLTVAAETDYDASTLVPA